MKLKRLIAILLSLVMTLGLLPTAAFAAGQRWAGRDDAGLPSGLRQKVFF